RPGPRPRRRSGSPDRERPGADIGACGDEGAWEYPIMPRAAALALNRPIVEQIVLRRAGSMSKLNPFALMTPVAPTWGLAEDRQRRPRAVRYRIISRSAMAISGASFPSDQSDRRQKHQSLEDDADPAQGGARHRQPEPEGARVVA